MSILRMILGWFGIRTALGSAEKARIVGNSIQGLGELEGADNVTIFGMGKDAKVIRQQDGARLIEEGGKRLWVDACNTCVDPDQWVDVFGPVGSDDVVTFCFHMMAFDQTLAGDPEAAEAKLRGFGYADVGQYFKVRNTMLKYHGAPNHGTQLQGYAFTTARFNQALADAAMLQQRERMKETERSQAHLFEPIEGVSFETYAEITGKSTSLDQSGMLQLLASEGMDYPKWERISQAWLDRMAQDTTGTMATKYSAAFMSAGSGQFGASAQSLSTSYSGGGAAGGEAPISFDAMCEIQGAIATWPEHEIAHRLQREFSMSSLDWATASSWWMTHMQSNLHMFDDYETRVAAAKAARDGGHAPSDRDADLTF